MTSASRSRLVAVAGLLLTISLAGCGGPKTVKVHGTVTHNGEAMKVEKTTLVTITFAPADQTDGQTYPAKYDYEGGTYTVTVPPGQYRAGLIIAAPNGKPPLSSPMSASKTYDLKEDQKIDLDLGK